MTLRLPLWLPAPVIECVAGHFPAGDESAMRRVGDYWSDMADWCHEQEHIYESKAAQRHLLVQGVTGDAIEGAYRTLATNFRSQAEHSDTLAEQQYEGANGLELQKWTVIGFAVILAWTLAHAAITFTAGGALEAYTATVRTDTALRLAWSKMVQYISGHSARLAAERGALVLAGKTAVIGALQGGGINAAVQLKQVADGHRHEADGRAASLAGIAGGVGGGVGTVFGRWFGNRVVVPATTAVAARSGHTAVRTLVQVSGTAAIGGGSGIVGGLAGAGVSLGLSGEDLTAENLAEGLMPALTGGFVGAAAHGAAGIRAASPAGASDPPSVPGQLRPGDVTPITARRAAESRPPTEGIDTSGRGDAEVRNTVPDNVTQIDHVDTSAGSPIAEKSVSPKDPEPPASPLRDERAVHLDSENSAPTPAVDKTADRAAPQHPLDAVAAGEVGADPRVNGDPHTGLRTATTTAHTVGSGAAPGTERAGGHAESGAPAHDEPARDNSDAGRATDTVDGQRTTEVDSGPEALRNHVAEGPAETRTAAKPEAEQPFPEQPGNTRVAVEKQRVPEPEHPRIEQAGKEVVPGDARTSATTDPGAGPAARPRVSAPKHTAEERPPSLERNERSAGHGRDSVFRHEEAPEHDRVTDDGPERHARHESDATGATAEPQQTHPDDENRHLGEAHPDDTVDSATALRQAYRAEADDILAEYGSKDWSTVEDQDLRAMLLGADDREAALAVIEVINRSEGKVLRWTQVMGMLAVRDGHVGRMQAGEGKTLLFQAASALRAAQGKPVRVLTTRDTLALEAYDLGRKLFGKYGFDIRLMDPDHPYAPVEDKATISFGTLNADGFGELRGNVAPGRITYVDEVDAAVKSAVFILSEGTGNPAGPEVVAQVGDAHAFVRDAVQAGLLSETDFVRAAGAGEHDTLSTGNDRATLDRILGRDLTGQIQKIIGRLPSEAEAHRIAMAAAAEWRFTENDDYVVWHHPELGSKFRTDDDGKTLVVHGEKVLNPQSHRIYIIDRDSHRVMFDAETSTESRWNGGLAQAIEAKHGIGIRDDPASTTSVTVRELFSSDTCDEFGGLSATTDNADAELRRTATDNMRPANSSEQSGREIIDIPRFEPSRLRGADPANDIVVGTQGEKIEAMAGGISDMHRTGRPVLAICHRNSEVSTLSAELRARGVEHVAVDAKWFLEHGVTAEADLLTIFGKAGEQGMVLVINRQGGRGVDIPVGPEIDERGGLHVLLSSRSAEHRDIDIQAENRTARNGGQGSVQYFTAADDPLYSKSPRARISVIKYTAAAAQHESALAQHRAAAAEHGDAPTDRSRAKLDAARAGLENSRNTLGAAESGIRGLVSTLQPSGVARSATDPTSPHLPHAPPDSGHHLAATAGKGHPPRQPTPPPPQAIPDATTAAPGDGQHDPSGLPRTHHSSNDSDMQGVFGPLRARQLTPTHHDALARLGEQLRALGAATDQPLPDLSAVEAEPTASRQVTDGAAAVADPAPSAKPERLTTQAIAAEVFDAYGVEVLGLDKPSISMATALSVRNAISDAFDEDPALHLDVVLVAPMAGTTGAVVWDADNIIDTSPVVMVLNETFFGDPPKFRRAMGEAVRKGRLMAPTGDPAYDTVSHEMSHLRDRAAHDADSAEARAFGFLYSHFTDLRAAGWLERDALFDDWLGQLDGYSSGRKALRGDDRLFAAFGEWVSSFDSREALRAWAQQEGLSLSEGTVEREPLYRTWLRQLDADARSRLVGSDPPVEQSFGARPVFNPSEALAEANNAFGNAAPNDFTHPAYALQALLRGVPVAEAWRNAEHRHALAAARAQNPGVAPVVSDFRPSITADGTARSIAEAWRALSARERAELADRAPEHLNPVEPQGFILAELARLENRQRLDSRRRGAASSVSARADSVSSSELSGQPDLSPRRSSGLAAIDLGDETRGTPRSPDNAETESSAGAHPWHRAGPREHSPRTATTQDSETDSLPSTPWSTTRPEASDADSAPQPDRAVTDGRHPVDTRKFDELRPACLAEETATNEIFGHAARIARYDAPNGGRIWYSAQLHGVPPNNGQYGLIRRAFDIFRNRPAANDRVILYESSPIADDEVDGMSDDQAAARGDNYYLKWLAVEHGISNETADVANTDFPTILNPEKEILHHLRAFLSEVRHEQNELIQRAKDTPANETLARLRNENEEFYSTMRNWAQRREDRLRETGQWPRVGGPEHHTLADLLTWHEQTLGRPFDPTVPAVDIWNPNRMDDPNPVREITRYEVNYRETVIMDAIDHWNERGTDVFLGFGMSHYTVQKHFLDEKYGEPIIYRHGQMSGDLLCEKPITQKRIQHRIAEITQTMSDTSDPVTEKLWREELRALQYELAQQFPQADREPKPTGHPHADTELPDEIAACVPWVVDILRQFGLTDGADPAPGQNVAADLERALAGGLRKIRRTPGAESLDPVKAAIDTLREDPELDSMAVVVGRGSNAHAYLVDKNVESGTGRITLQVFDQLVGGDHIRVRPYSDWKPAYTDPEHTYVAYLESTPDGAVGARHPRAASEVDADFADLPITGPPEPESVDTEQATAEQPEVR